MEFRIKNFELEFEKLEVEKEFNERKVEKY